MTEAEKRATKRYRAKTNSITILFRMFREDEVQLYNYLTTIENKTEYIKGLVRQDMEEHIKKSRNKAL